MDELPFAPPKDLVRFMKKVEKREDGCWEWVGWKNEKGYGQVRLRGRTWRSHRLAYLWKFGKLPEYVQITGRIETDHLCRKRACVNPEHLEMVTPRVNALRGVGIAARNIAKTHCQRGHPYNQENTLIRREGKRRCRICQRIWQRNFYKKWIQKNFTEGGMG